MKCPQCQKNHQYKSGMTCVCGYRFSLDPKVDGMADGKFLGIVRKVSANQTQYFTTNQFHAERCRRERFSMTCGVIALLIGALAFAAPFVIGEDTRTFFLIVSAVAGLIGVVALLASLFNQGPSLKTTNRLIETWQQRKGPIDHLLTTPTLDEPPPEWKEPDIYDYGVERILIVQRDLLVDLFVMNNFHSEQRTLVVSASGYPSYLAPIAAKLAQQREDLPIFVMHDASESSKQTASRATRFLGVSESRMIDMGISAADCKKLKSLRRLGKQGNAARSVTVPVDFLIYRRMSELTAACFVGNLAYQQVLAQQLAGDGHSSMSFG